MVFKGFGISVVAERVRAARVTVDGQSFEVPARLALAIVAERRAGAEALAAAGADAARERDRAIQAEAGDAEAREQVASERLAHVERLRALLDRVAPGLASDGEEQLLARIEVACEAAVRDGELLRRCSAWARA